MVSSKFIERLGKKSLLSKVCTAEDCIKFLKNGMHLGWSGFTPSGYPKVVPIAMADYVEKNKLQGKIKFNLYAGASMGAETEDRWAKLDMITKRLPYQTGKNIAEKINKNEIHFQDMHLSKFANFLAWGISTKENNGDIDVGLIEASEIRPDGEIVLSSACGVSLEIINRAKQLIIELNTAIPSYYGMHDMLPNDLPPNRRPYLISRVDDRMGSPSIKCDPDKIIAIVESQAKDNGRNLGDSDEESNKISQNILDFFELEVKHGRLPKNLLPLQSGVGNIANAVVSGLSNGKFEDLTVWTEVLQDGFLDFFKSGKLKYASATSLSLSNKGFERLYKEWDYFSSKIILRPQQISNNPEIIKRLGCIAMNTPVEMDIYGHVNSTHIGGTKMINGLGGSGDFLRNGFVSIMHTPSSRPSKKDKTGITCVVPFCSHIDHTEHDLDVFVTEQGFFDMRGLSPVQRARGVIKYCAHPDYKEILNSYLDLSLKKCVGAAHEPHMLSKVFKMYESLEKDGTMKIKSW